MAANAMTNAPVCPAVRKKGNGQMTEERVAHAASIEDAARLLQDGIIQSLSGLSKIESDIVLLVRKTVSDTLHTGGSAAGELVKVVHHVVMGTIGAVEQAGTGLTMSVKSVAKGIVMGVHDVGDDVVLASAEILRSVVNHAGAVGADIGAMAKRAVDGVIEATAEIGGDVGKVGKRAIAGAIDEAGNISKMAVATVTEVLNGVAGSIRQIRQTAVRLPVKPVAAANHRARSAKKPQVRGSGKAL